MLDANLCLLAAQGRRAVTQPLSIALQPPSVALNRCRCRCSFFRKYINMMPTVGKTNLRGQDTLRPDEAFLGVGRRKEGFWASYRSGDAAGCCPEDRGSNPHSRQAGEEYEEDLRRQAADGTSDGARRCRCAVDGALLLCFHVDIPDTVNIETYLWWDKNYEDETRHPSTGGTDGGAGC